MKELKVGERVTITLEAKRFTLKYLEDALKELED